MGVPPWGLGINVMKRRVGYMAFRRSLSINLLPRAIMAFWLLFILHINKKPKCHNSEIIYYTHLTYYIDSVKPKMVIFLLGNS